MPHDPPLPHRPPGQKLARMPALMLWPGRLLVTILVTLDHAATLWMVRPEHLLHGLRTARDLLSFGELCREEPRLEETFPWTGNV